MKKQESNKKTTETHTTETEMTAKTKKTFTNWLIRVIGASALAGICELNGSSDGGEVYRNLRL